MAKFIIVSSKDRELFTSTLDGWRQLKFTHLPFKKSRENHHRTCLRAWKHVMLVAYSTELVAVLLTCYMSNHTWHLNGIFMSTFCSCATYPAHINKSWSVRIACWQPANVYWSSWKCRWHCLHCEWSVSHTIALPRQGVRKSDKLLKFPLLMKIFLKAASK